MTEVENEQVVQATTEDEPTEQELAARAAQAELNSKLNELGSEATSIARAAGRVLEQADGFFKSLADLCIQARSLIGKKSKDGSPVHDWDGGTPEYRKWYREYIETALSEHAPVEVFEMPSKIEGADPEQIVVTDGDWVRTAKRSIQYHVQTKIGGYLRENGFEHEAILLGLDLRTPAEKMREARLKAKTSGGNEDGSESGVPAPTKQLEQLIQDNGSFELKSGWVVSLLNDLTEVMTVEALAALPADESKRVQSHIARAQGILESLVLRFESAEMVAKEQARTAAATA